jgi:branched-chain amino acid transport system permease protein
MNMSSSFVIRRSRRSSGVSTVVMILVAAALVAMPYVVFQSVTSSMVMLFVLVILASMWNLLAGFGGLVSIGQQAYIGVGAYTVIVFADFGMNPFLAVLFGGLTSAILALPTSWLAFRLRGDYFAVGTWVIAEVYRLVIIKFDFVGGADGKSLVGLGDMDSVLRSAVVYWFALAIAIATVIGCFLLLRGRVGLALTAIRDDEVAARAAGVDATRIKRIVYLVSAAGCGLAGGILVIDALRVQPDAIFNVSWSAYMIFIVIIGGIGYLEGPLIGAIVFFAMQQFFAEWGSWYLMLLGALAIVIAAWFPKGLWGSFSQRTGFRLFPVGYHVAEKFGEPMPGVKLANR